MESYSSGVSSVPTAVGLRVRIRPDGSYEFSGKIASVKTDQGRMYIDYLRTFMGQVETMVLDM